MKTVYFLFGIPLENLYQEMAVVLQRDYGFDGFTGAIWNQGRRRYLDDGRIAWRDLWDIHASLKEIGDETPDWDYLAAAERMYGWPTLATMSYSDQWFGHGEHDTVVRFMQHVLRAVEERYRQLAPDLVIIDPVADFTSYAHFAVARHMGIPVYSFDSGVVPGRFAVYSSPYRFWDRVDGLFDTFVSTGISPDLHAQARQYIEAFRQNETRPPAAVQWLTFRLAKAEDWQKLLTHVVDWVYAPRGPVQAKPWRVVWQRTQRVLRQRWCDFRGVFGRPDARDSYVLFPLHVQPEASTSVLAPMFVNQAALIEDIARCLPAGQKLYVKEHFAFAGKRPLSFYRQIGRLWNVELIHPFADSFQLVRQARALVTITGTMGWEALLLGKPVMTFGEVCYNSFPDVIKAGRRPKGEWPGLVETLLDTCIDEDLLTMYVGAVLVGTYEGLMADPATLPHVLEAENVERLCFGLMDTFERRATTDGEGMGIGESSAGE